MKTTHPTDPAYAAVTLLALVGCPTTATRYTSVKIAQGDMSVAPRAGVLA